MLLETLTKEFLMKSVGGSEIKKMLDKEKVKMVDIDTKTNFNNSHLKGSVNLPHDEKDFMGKIEKKFASKTETIVVCARPALKSQAKKICNEMKKNGYKKVYEYTADPSDWRNAGLSVM